MKRTLFFMALLFIVLLCRTPPAEATMTYGVSYYDTNRGYIGSGGYNDPIRRFINEVETTLDGTSGMTVLFLTPGTAPSGEEGMIYYDSSSHGLLVHTGSGFVTIDTAGASSLDTAYNTGSTIDVDGDAVTLTVSSGDNNRVLDLVQNDSASNPETIRITNAGSGDTLQFVSTGGKDVDGTSSSWSVTHAGVGTFLGVDIGGSDIVLENDEIIHNTADTEIGFKATEDIVIDLDVGTNIVGWKSNTGVTTWDYGALTSIIGMTTITGDPADFTISSTGDATGEDVIISQAGTGDNQVIIQSAGTAANAIAITASVAGIDIDAIDDLYITNTASTSGDDFVIQQVGAHDASLLVTSAGTGGDAISLTTSAATGDIVINSGDMINIDAADDILIDLAGATGEDILVTNTGGSITLSASEAVADAVVLYASNAAGGIDVDAGTGGIDVLTTGVFSIDGAAASNVSVASGATDENLTLSVTGATASSLILSSAGTGDDAVDLNATAGGLDVDTVKAIHLTSVENSADSVKLQSTLGGIDILADASGGEAIDISNTGGPINIISTEEGDATIHIETTTATGQLQITVDDTTTDALEIDVLGGIEIDAAEDIAILLTAGTTGEDLTIKTTGAVDNHIVVESAGTSADALTLQASNAAGGIWIDAGTTGLDLDCVAGDISISNTGAKDIDIDATAGQVFITGTQSVADAVRIIADGANGEISLSAKVGGIDIDAASGPIVITAAGASGDIIDITNTTGTGASATTQTDAAIQIEATAGGISLESGLAAVDAIRLETDGASATIIAQSITSTAASATTEQDASIQLYSEAGGIGITSDLAAADAVRIEAQGADGLITVQNILGTTASAATEFDASIQLYSQVGGVGLHSKLNGADAIRIEEGGGTGGTINIHANTGTAVADGAASVNLLSDVGGISLKATALASADAIWIQSGAGGVNLDAAATYDVDIDGGQILLTASHSVADAILLHADAGAAQEINLLNDEGTNAGAIDLTATLGGIAMACKDDFIVTLTTTATDDDMTFQTTGSDDTHIEILADGTSENAITITASAGNVDIQGDGASGEDMDLVSTNSAMNLSSGEASADAISLTTGNGAGGITINTGSAGVTFSDDPISDVGDLECDDVIADANANTIISAVKMLVVSISVDESPATDFGFDDTQANKVEQGVRVGVLPANCMVNSVFVKCVETLTGGGIMGLEIGTATGGNQILTTVACDTANDVMSTAAGETPEVAAGTAAIDVFVSGTPGTNDWDEITAGSWDICIVYTDFAAALTQTGT